MTARIHYGLTYAEYVSLPGWRWSHIKLMHDGSPRHVQHALQARGEETASQSLLRAIHCLVLEPHTFDRQFSVYDGRRSEREKLYRAFLACHPNTTVLNPREFVEARATAEAIRSHPDVRPFLEEGDAEVCITWTDEATGLPCKARLDWLGRAILDLKTLGTVHERRVASMVAGRLYHAQLAHYDAGVQAVGLPALPVHLVVAEGAGAHDVALFALDRAGPDGALYRGAEIRRALLEQLAECVAADRWPGRHSGPVDLVLPTWATTDLDDLTFGAAAADSDAASIPWGD